MNKLGWHPPPGCRPFYFQGGNMESALLKAIIKIVMNEEQNSYEIVQTLRRLIWAFEDYEETEPYKPKY